MTFRSHHRLLFLVGLRTKFALLFVVSPAFLLGLVQLSPEARAQSNWGRQVDQQQQAVGSNRRDRPVNLWPVNLRRDRLLPVAVRRRSQLVRQPLESRFSSPKKNSSFWIKCSTIGSTAVKK